MEQIKYQQLSLLIGIILIIIFLAIMIYLFLNIELIKSDPCKLCVDKGFNCINMDFFK